MTSTQKTWMLSVLQAHTFSHLCHAKYRGTSKLSQLNIKQYSIHAMFCTWCSRQRCISPPTLPFAHCIVPEDLHNCYWPRTKSTAWKEIADTFFTYFSWLSCYFLTSMFVVSYWFYLSVLYLSLKYSTQASLKVTLEYKISSIQTILNVNQIFNT